MLLAEPGANFESKLLKNHFETADAFAILPADFELPDLSPPEEGFGDKKEIKEFQFSFRGNTWIGKISFEVYKSRSQRGQWDQLGGIRFEIFDPVTKERVSNFASRLWRESVMPLLDKKYDDQTGSVCQIYNRFVEPAERKKGLGGLSICLIEELVNRINKEYPILRIRKIHITTTLSSLSRLIADRGWLQNKGLGEFGSKDHDLGFKPHPSDETDAIRILQSGTTELNDILGKNMKEVLYIKDLK